MLGLMDGAELGKPYWSNTVSSFLPASLYAIKTIATQQHYFKAHAYRVTPLKPKGNFAIDGEAYPFEPFQVEVHQGLARFLSPYGRYAVDFSVPPPEEQALRELKDGEERGALASVLGCCFPSGKQAEE